MKGENVLLFKYLIMVRLLFISILLSLVLSVYSQEKISGIEINSHYGKIIPHHENLQKLESFYNMYDIRLFWRTYGAGLADSVYKYPIYGLGFSFIDIRNKNIGNPINLYGFIELPFTKPGKLRVGMEVDLGMSFGYKGFHPEDNPDNRAISSDINCFVSISIPVRISLGKKMDFSFAPALYHSSNGGSKVPNTGLNMIGGRAGLSFYFDDKKELVYRELPGIKRRTSIETYAASGYVDNEDDYSNTKYMTATFSLGLFQRIGYKRKLGIGTDFFYNAANKVKFNNKFKKTYLIQNAVFVSHEYIYRRIGIITQLGYYIYSKYETTEPLYERVGVRWYFGKKMFTGIAVKAHLFNAEFIEWSLGYSIPL